MARPNTTIRIFEDIFSVFYFFTPHDFFFRAEGRFLRTFLSFLIFSKRAATLFEDIFQLFTFFLTLF